MKADKETVAAMEKAGRRPPCRGCDMRVMGCHAECGQYQAYAAARRWVNKYLGDIRDEEARMNHQRARRRGQKRGG